MIAHSFRGEVFGPTQRLHGATFVISAEFKTAELDENGIVVDIGTTQDLLGEVLEPLRFRNLDDIEEFNGKNTTTEFVARYIHEQLGNRVRSYFSGHLRIVLEESHLAWGSYEAPV